VPLTKQEKVAGRAFRETQQRALRERCEADPPTYVVPHFLAIFRHLCERRDNVSTALELREVYIASPAYDVYDLADDAWYAFPADAITRTAISAHDHDPQHSVHVPAGRFGFLYRDGRCRRCGRTARSDRGRLVTSDRPPLHPGRTGPR
jgi:hypothetical protein